MSKSVVIGPLAPPPDVFQLEAEPTHYVRSFPVGQFQCWVWRVDDRFRWNVETVEGAERAKGANTDAGLAESDARKAAISLMLEAGGAI